MYPVYNVYVSNVQVYILYIYMYIFFKYFLYDT